MSEGNIVKSLEKAMRVMECFARGEPEQGVSELSRKVGINKSNTFEILHTLMRMGYVEQNAASQKYSLSVKMLTFSSAVNQHVGYHRVVYDIMDDLAESVQNIVYFSIPHGYDVLYLYSSFPKAQRQRFPYRPVGGEICPMHCSSMGKSMLAFSGRALLDGVKEKGLECFTDATITDPGKLDEEIEGVRTNGFAVDRGEHQYGVGAVGVPILNNHGKLIAAMSICGIVSSFSQENIERFAQSLKEAAFQIRVRL